MIALAGGVLVGVTAGYVGGFWDAMLMRIMDLLLSFPYLLLAIVLVTAFGSGVFNTTLAIGIWAMPTFARMVTGVGNVPEEKGVCHFGPGGGGLCFTNYFFPTFFPILFRL